MVNKSYKGVNVVCSVSTGIIGDIARAAAISNSEVILKFNKDGMMASSVDVTNSMAFRMDINTDTYVYDGEDGVEICVEVNDLLKVVKTGVKDGISKIVVKGGIGTAETHGVKIKLPLFGDYRALPGNVDEIIDMLPDRINMVSSTFARFVAAAKSVDSNISMMVEDGNFIVSAGDDGNTNNPDVEMVVPDSDVTVDPDCVDVLTLFSSEYIIGIVDVLSKVAKRIRIRLGRDMPCTFATKLKDYEILYLVAPRIEKTDEDDQ